MASVVRSGAQIKNNLAEYIAPECILDACQQARHAWRDRLLGAVLTVHAFLMQILHGNTAMTNVARLVNGRFSPGAYCQARQRLPLAVLKCLLRSMVRKAGDATAQVARWHGHRTFFVDGSSCSMADRHERAPVVPAGGGHDPRRLRSRRDPHAEARFLEPGASDPASRVTSGLRRERFLSQPFFVAEQFTGFPGNYTKKEDTIRSFKELCDGKWDHLTESAFMYVGPIEEAAEKAERMKAEG